MDLNVYPSSGGQNWSKLVQIVVEWPLMGCLETLCLIFTDCSEIMYLVIIEISLQVFPKPCTVDVFLGQPIKLIQDVSASEFHEC